MKYCECKRSKNGEFSPKIKEDNNKYLDIYCKINNLNKTQFVNQIIAEKMEELFERLRH